MRLEYEITSYFISIKEDVPEISIHPTRGSELPIGNRTLYISCMSDLTIQESLVDSFARAGLKREQIGDTCVYTLDSANQGFKSSLDTLKGILTNKRVAVEVGPGNQLESLQFAGNVSNADLTIGIDPNFEFSKISSPHIQGSKRPILLLKGDARGNSLINNFFNSNSENPHDRLAIYSQVVAPDSLVVNAMLSATLSKSRGGMLAVLDSGALEALSQHHYSDRDVQRKLLEERGYENPTELDWIKSWLRGMNQIELSADEYQAKANEGVFPQTPSLRAGKMLVLSIPMTSSTI